jgi:type IX secretion system PorP/SprF family membrane protein
MKYLKIHTLVLFAGMLAWNARSQDLHFSQTNETPLLINPANTGFYNGYIRAIANYRNQWQSMGKAFQTMNLSVDAGLFKSKRRKSFLGLGLVIFQDQAGAAKFRKTNALLNISGLIKVSKNSVLSAGICGGAVGTNADYSKLTFASQFDGNEIDPELPTGENVIFRSFTTTDLGAGLAYEFGKVKTDQDHDDVMKVKLGAAAYHLNRPKQEFSAGADYRLPIRWVGSINSVIDFEDTRFTVTPTFIYMRQGKAWQYITGSYLKVRLSTATKVTGEKTQNSLGLGLFYRSKDALIPQMCIDLGDYSIGMSYDINISGYKAASRYMGGFEISLRYNKLANSLFDTRREY